MISTLKVGLPDRWLKQFVDQFEVRLLRIFKSMDQRNKQTFDVSIETNVEEGMHSLHAIRNVPIVSENITHFIIIYMHILEKGILTHKYIKYYTFPEFQEQFNF